MTATKKSTAAPAYAWLITVDHIKDDAPDITAPSNQNAEGMTGPSGITLSADDIKRIAASTQAQPFKMYDDDDELYYEGLFIGDIYSDDAFGPLDDFGQPNAGCTRIEFLYPDGRWRSL